MRLHHIVLSTFVAVLICGCGNEKPEQPAQPVSTATDQGSLGSLLPGDDVEKLLFRREKGQEAKEQQEDAESKHLESQLVQAVHVAEQASDRKGMIRAEIELGNFYADKRSLRDATTEFARAVSHADALEPGNPLALEAIVRLGETYIRRDNFPKALGCFERASDESKGKRVDDDMAARIALGHAWILRCIGEPDEAQRILTPVKRSYAKNTAAYRVVLLEEAVMAMDAEDKRAANAAMKAIAALPTVTPKEASFGKQFTRWCSRNCRKRGETEL